ncbi:MAG TPA: hypothetical protein EYQ00_06615 [Dehalococcoidia bacterium]|jgi:hypothetical protein|nr:hypothetical protein [Dehalococcoidia bacterium]
MNDSGWLESREGELDPDLTEDWSDIDSDYMGESQESHGITGLVSGFLLVIIVFPIVYFLFR